MGAEDVKIQVGDENPAPAVEIPMTREASQPSSLERAKVATNLAGAATGTSTPAQAEQIDEKGSTGNEKCRTAKGQMDIEFGALVAVFSFAVMLAAFFLVPAGAKRGPENWRLDFLMLLAFASFICGFSFMLLSMQLLEAKEVHVSSCHRVISRCLFLACSVLPALTLLILLVVMPFKPYVYVGLAVLSLVAVPVAVMHCYTSRRTEGAGGAPSVEAAGESNSKEQAEEMEASFKITAAMAASSFAGLVGMLFGVYKQSGAGGGGGATPDNAVHVAVMFMFTTAVVSMLLMMLSVKVLEINNQDHRRSIIRVIRHANSALLCSLAVAALSAAFVILRYYVVATFVSLAFAGMVHFIIQNCTTAAAQVNAEQRVDDLSQERQGNNNDNDANSNGSHSQETKIKWMTDISSKVTSYSLGGVMAIFGGFLGDTDNNNHNKMMAIKICMYLLTTAFASGLGLMFLTTRLSSGSGDRVGFKLATTILAWSTMGLLGAAALAIYGVEVMRS
ncbi:hypothetical protein QOZ80_6BG0496880 [Eleusine coracana subsp. coracana]|nr:hypothetical protein QOZ80_6BG0496880 [Eleusine coracana subsp. coracana]